jgi:hypothetical protein
MIFHDENLCLADNAIIHIILKENKFFEYLTLINANVIIISGPVDMIKNFKRANILLSNNTKLGIKYALYSLESRKNLPNFKYIHANGYYIEIIDEKKEYLYIISCISGQKLVLEKLHAFSFGIYNYTIMKSIKTNVLIH